MDGIDIIPEDPEEVFEVLESAGAGNYGVVMKARNRFTNDIVAVKQILVTDTSEIESIQQEILILSRCHHPNVVEYYGTYKSLGKLWIVMEYCEGGSVDLVFKIMHRPLGENLIAYVAREVLSGLSYMHANHYLHRDIKCSNILLTKDGRVKLADFGVSTQLQNTMSKRNTFIGTVLWMAPEAILESDYDGRADLWSLGISVIEMAQGAPPHAGAPPARTVFIIPREDPPTLHPKDRWSPQMNMFVKRLLTKNKNARPNAEAMLHDPFVNGDDVGSREEMSDVVLRLLEQRETISSARLRHGEFSSDSATATFVRRPASGGDQSGSSRASSKGTASTDGTSGRSEAANGRKEEAAPKPEPSFLLDGTLTAVPLLRTNDISFDELGYAEAASDRMMTSSLGPDAAADPADFMRWLNITDPELIARSTPGFLMQGTATLQHLHMFNATLTERQKLSRDQANKLSQSEAKYSSALKQLYHLV